MTQRRPVRIYHDDSPWPHLELGPQDDSRYLEQLVKAIFAAGLNWQVVQSHWAALSEAFHGFDPVQLAAMTERDIDRAAQNPHVIRNRRKISESVESAAAANEVIAEHGSFDAFLRSFRLARGGDRGPAGPLSRPGRLLRLVVHAVGRAAGPAG